MEEAARGPRAEPAHPTHLGRRGDQIALGLPGNPAPAAVGSHLLGRPLLGNPDGWWRRAALNACVETRAGRAALLRGAEGPERLTPAPDQGSPRRHLAGRRHGPAWVGEDDDGAAGSEVRFTRLA